MIFSGTMEFDGNWVREIMKSLDFFEPLGVQDQHHE